MRPASDTRQLGGQPAGEQSTASNASYGSSAETSSQGARHHHHHQHEPLEPVPAFVETLPSRRSTVSTPVSQAASNPPVGTARGRGRARSYAVTDYPADVVSTFLLDQRLASILSPARQPSFSTAGHDSLPSPVNQQLPYEQPSSGDFTLNLSPVNSEVLSANRSLSLSSDHQLSSAEASCTCTEPAVFPEVPSAYRTTASCTEASFADDHQLSETEGSFVDNTTAFFEEPSFSDSITASHTEALPAETPQPSPNFFRRASSVLFRPQTSKTDASAIPSSSSGSGHIFSLPNEPFINTNESGGPAESEQPDQPHRLIASPSDPSPPWFHPARTSHTRSDSQETIRAIRTIHAHRRTDSQETVRRIRRSDSQETIRPAPPLTSIKMSSKAQASLQEATGTKLPVRLVCPPWDRRVDIKWSRGKDITWSGARELSAFRTSFAMAVRASGTAPATNELANPFCCLPDKIRYMICKYLIPESDKPIRLNTGNELYKAVWPEAAFEPLESVLADIANYTNVCRAVRTDVLMTLLNTRRFHVVVCPLGLAMLDPIGHSWFGMYAGYMQFLTIEVDFARLGFAKEPGAALLDPLAGRFESRLVAYGEAQRARALFQQYELDKAGFFALDQTAEMNRAGAGESCGSTVHDLTVTVRRYFGNRPEDAGRVVPQKYSDDKYLSVLQPLGRALRGKVDHLRVVGTSIPAANDLIASVWDVEDLGVDGDIRLCGPSFYPSLPGQASVLVDANDREYYFRHPGAFLGARDFLLDEAFVRGQLEVGNQEAAGPGDKGKGKGKGKEEEEEDEEEKGPLGTFTVPEAAEQYDQSALLGEMQEVASAIDRVAAAGPVEGGGAEEEEGEKGKGKEKGKLRVVTGRLQKKVSKLVLGGGASKDSDGKE